MVAAPPHLVEEAPKLTTGVPTDGVIVTVNVNVAPVQLPDNGVTV